MQTLKVIETEIGILWGRDCVYLNHTSKPEARTLLLCGQINCRNVRKLTPPLGWENVQVIPYKLLFHNVLGFQMLELETWDSQNDDTSALMESCFEEVHNSSWLKRLEGKRTDSHRHLRLATYDDVFDVLCETYVWHFGDQAK